jgi:hypothetical protein
VEGVFVTVQPLFDANFEVLEREFAEKAVMELLFPGVRVEGRRLHLVEREVDVAVVGVLVEPGEPDHLLV